MNNGSGEGLGWIAGSLQEVTETLFDLMRANPFYLNTETEPYSPGDAVGLITPQVDQGWLHIQNILNPFVLFLATLGILLAALRLLWQRRLDPMMDLIRGLLTVIVTTFAGIFIVTVLVALSRALTDMVLHFNLDPDEVDQDLLDRAAEVYPSVLRTAMNEEAESVGFAGPAAQGAITEMVGLAVIVGLTVQVVVLALLQAIIYLIVCVLPLAAASTMVPNLRIFTKLVGWLLACLLYKPLIMLMYLAGLVLLGINTGDNALFRYLLGAAVMLLATGALPVLMKLMSSPGVWALALGSTFLGGGSGGGSGAATGGASGEGASGDASGAGVQNTSAGGSAPGTGGGDGSASGAEAANDRAGSVEAGLGNADFGSGAAVQTAGFAGDGGSLAAAGDAGGELGGSGGALLTGATGGTDGGSAVTGAAAAGGAAGAASTGGTAGGAGAPQAGSATALESDGAVSSAAESAVASEVSLDGGGDAASGAADAGSAGDPGSALAAPGAADAGSFGDPGTALSDGVEAAAPGTVPAVPTASHDAPTGATEA
ncbi:hypothetical protein [Nocardiopsis potens]|uniref:hypothetical protein n=1 Tax=Nocardiopsis potens TaxID=1246458 RepID=UPI000344E0D9|nr:hypothetical protein [Nocardiopsis potens]